MSDYVETSVAGIPCLAEVTTYNVVPPWKGSVMTAPSDLDYYGYTELEYTICDRKKYPADWLSKKMTSKDEQQVESDIHDYYKGKEYDYEGDEPY